MLPDKQTVMPGDDEGEGEVSGGTFTQAQVNAIVQDRLARQKTKLMAGYQEKLARLTQVESELTALKEKSLKYQEHFTASLAERKKALPAGVLKLLDGLDPVDQAAWLDENAETVGKPPVHPGPVTPKPDSKGDPVDVINQKRSNSNLYSL